MMNKNWPVKKLGEVTDVTDFVANGSFATLKTNVKYLEQEEYAILVRTTDLINNFKGKLVYIDKNAYDFLKKSKLFGGEIILSNVGTIGNVFRTPIINKPMSLAPNAVMVKPNPYNDFLFYYLKSNQGQLQIKSITSQTSQPKFNKTDLRNLQIPIPSSGDQKKIVERLDAIRKAQELCDQQIHKTEELFESILETETISNSIDLHELSFFTEKVTYGFTNPMPTNNEGPYMVTAKDITGGEVNYNSCRRTTQEAYDKLITDKSRPELGDILLTKDGTLGRVALVTMVPLCINQSVALIKPNMTKVIPQYLKLLLGSSKYQRIMIANAGGAIIKHIYITTIDKMMIAVPSLKEQQRIVEKLEAVQNYKKLLQKEKTLLKELFDSVLDKSMKGELDN